MPIYNAAPYLTRAVESIRAQSFADWQLLAIDDGSTDESVKIMSHLASADYRLIVQQQANAGPGQVMNRALEHARSGAIPFVARMDADDISEPRRFEQQLALLARASSAAACGSNCLYIDENDATIGSSTVPLTPHRIRSEIRRGLRGIVQGATMFRTEAVAAVGGYRAEFRFAEEVDLFLRLSDRFDLINAPEFLYRIRLHSRSLGVANIKLNTQHSFYALDCAHRRRLGMSKREFDVFLHEMDPWTRFRIAREIAAVRLWRVSRSAPLRPLVAISALLDPKRAFARVGRYVERCLNL